MNPVLIIVGVLVGLLVGFVIGKLLTGSKAKEIDNAAKNEANLLLEKAKANAQSLVEKAEDKAKNVEEKAKTREESIKQSKILEAKEFFIQKKQEFDSEANTRNQKIQHRENQLKDQQKSLSKKMEENSRREKRVRRLK